MKILTEKQIQQKIKRLSIEILENHYDEKEIILAGINNNGVGFAKMIKKELEARSTIQIILTQIRLNPADPIESKVFIKLNPKELTGKVIIIIDDVANTGRTLFYAFKPLLKVLPKTVEVAVLIDRKHKSFPVLVDYLGLSLATTLKEHIDVQILHVKEKAVFLN